MYCIFSTMSPGLIVPLRTKAITCSLISFISIIPLRNFTERLVSLPSFNNVSILLLLDGVGDVDDRSSIIRCCRVKTMELGETQTLVGLFLLLFTRVAWGVWLRSLYDTPDFRVVKTFPCGCGRGFAGGGIALGGGGGFAGGGIALGGGIFVPTPNTSHFAGTLPCATLVAATVAISARSDAVAIAAAALAFASASASITLALLPFAFDSWDSCTAPSLALVPAPASSDDESSSISTAPPPLMLMGVPSSLQSSSSDSYVSTSSGIGVSTSTRPNFLPSSYDILTV